MSNDVSFKRAEYTTVLDRWATVRDVCAGQHRVVDRLPYDQRARQVAGERRPEQGLPRAGGVQERHRAHPKRAAGSGLP